jgi:thymidylate synthase
MIKKYFEGDHINDIYLQLIESISTEPEYIVKPRGFEIKENINVTVLLKNPKNSLLTLTERKMNYAFAIIEKMEYASGETQPDRLGFYNKNFASFKNKFGYFDGSYPERLNYWFRHIYETLKADPDSRQAVMTIYGIQDRHESKDIPCTSVLQFFLRDNKLHLAVYMRSNDLLWGVPYDTNGFCFLLEIMAAMLNVGVGTYTLHAGSMHIYTEREEQLTKLLNNPSVDTIQNPAVEPAGFDEMKNNFKLFWLFEDSLRNKSEPATALYSMMPAWLREYADIIREYNAKKERNG